MMSYGKYKEGRDHESNLYPWRSGSSDIRTGLMKWRTSPECTPALITNEKFQAKEK